MNNNTRETQGAYINNKWCSVHKMKSHNTKDCTLNQDTNNRFLTDNTPPSSLNTNKRSLIISDTRTNTTNHVEIQTIINDRETDMVIDSGADVSYANEEAVKDLSYAIEETRSITLIFGGGKKEITDKKVVTDVLINGIKYKAEFYVLSNLPVNFILGNDFLTNQECLIDYKKRRIILGDNNTISFKGEKPQISDILEERLSDKTCLTIIQEFPTY
ncbi:Protein DDI1 like protein 2 [Nosema granulosis]|uniref:Protein DDI1 like protein 2 n=1 Tax=Nosema granulosis TaxID=83296 RepID=A0A9P6GX99_9MICR|nr:Protein DDI1 like protein 2 [Nosema granulosis]